MLEWQNKGNDLPVKLKINGKHRAITITAIREPAFAITNNETSPSISALLGHKVVRMIALRLARRASVVQKETVAVSSTETPRLTASELHTRATALFRTAGAICDDLEIRGNSRAVVENVGNVVACACAVEVGAKHVCFFASCIFGWAGDDLCFGGGGRFCCCLPLGGVGGDFHGSGEGLGDRYIFGNESCGGRDCLDDSGCLHTCDRLGNWSTSFLDNLCVGIGKKLCACAKIRQSSVDIEMYARVNLH